MDHAEVEFIAENEKVKIVPNFKEDVLYLISGDFGPFTPGLEIEVPLWVAKMLHRKQKCQIVPPDWMNLETFQRIKDDESRSSTFTKLPNDHFFEMTRIIISVAMDHLPQVDQLRIVMKDIENTRSAKLRTSINRFIKAQAGRAQVDNLTRLEINDIEGFLTASLDEMYQLKQTQQHVEDRAAASAASLD